MGRAPRPRGEINGKTRRKSCNCHGRQPGYRSGDKQAVRRGRGPGRVRGPYLKEGDHILEGSLEMTCAQIRESGGEATPIAANISLPEDCERLIEETKAAYGPADVLVNNAALTYFIPIKDYPLNRWMRTWAVNIHAPFPAEPARTPRHDRQEERQHSQHFIQLRHWPGPRPVR